MTVGITRHIEVSFSPFLRCGVSEADWDGNAESEGSSKVSGPDWSAELSRQGTQSEEDASCVNQTYSACRRIRAT